jgi:hypothetical protein
MNIWIWPEFLELLSSVGAISSEEAKMLLFSDNGITFNQSRCDEMSNKITPGINLSGKKHVTFNHIHLAHLFFLNCGGFYVR